MNDNGTKNPCAEIGLGDYYYAPYIPLYETNPISIPDSIKTVKIKDIEIILYPSN